jgi:peptidyl-dipeptidase Dcp
VTYPGLAGTNVPSDYVEFPSQLLEHWVSTPEVMTRFMLHFQTGEPIPAALRQKIERAAKFNQGFNTTELLACALVDMRFHLASPEGIDSKKFEDATLKDLGMPKEMVMRHRPPHFLHIFTGDQYASGYYSYVWSVMLSSDAFSAFEEGKGPFDPAVAERLRKDVFSVGNTIDPADGYRKFRGRDPKVDAFMKERGF